MPEEETPSQVTRGEEPPPLRLAKVPAEEPLLERLPQAEWGRYRSLPAAHLSLDDFYEIQQMVAEVFPEVQTAADEWLLKKPEAMAQIEESPIRRLVMTAPGFTMRLDGPTSYAEISRCDNANLGLLQRLQEHFEQRRAGSGFWTPTHQRIGIMLATYAAVFIGSTPWVQNPWWRFGFGMVAAALSGFLLMTFPMVKPPVFELHLVRRRELQAKRSKQHSEQVARWKDRAITAAIASGAVLLLAYALKVLQSK